jgi:hypothetical protein
MAAGCVVGCLTKGPIVVHDEQVAVKPVQTP